MILVLVKGVVRLVTAAASVPSDLGLDVDVPLDLSLSLGGWVWAMGWSWVGAVNSPSCDIYLVILGYIVVEEGFCP